MSISARAYVLPRRALIFLVELYRTWISPMRLPTCRFEPTCSTYAVEALEKRGLIVGSLLTMWRLLKCGPWHKPGYDPVPERVPRRHRDAATDSSHSNGSASDGERAMSDRGY